MHQTLMCVPCALAEVLVINAYICGVDRRCASISTLLLSQCNSLLDRFLLCSGGILYCSTKWCSHFIFD